MSQVALILGATVSVLAFAGVQAWAFAPAQVVVMLAATWEFWKRGFPEIGRARLCLVMVLLAVPLVQLLPLPEVLVGALSPNLVALRQALFASPETGAAVSAITIHPYETRQAFLRLICYVLVFLLAFRMTRRARGGEVLLRTLIGLGLFEALYGLVQYLADWHYIFAYKKQYYTSDATGTYINHNHFAGLLEMVLPFVVARILFRANRPTTGLRSLIVSPRTSQLLGDVVIVVILGTALVFSRSRMGIAAGVGAVLFAWGITFFQARRRVALAIALLIFALPIGYSAWIGLEPVMERYERLAEPEALEKGRLLIWRDTGRLIRDYPLLGTGLGTYAWSSLHFQSDWFETRYEHAHNDYLEFAADVGIPTTVLLFGGLWLLVFRTAVRASALERSQDRILAAGCASSMAAILTHEIADFNLQIPANAFLFSWIVGTAAALVSRPDRRHTRDLAPVEEDFVRDSG